MKPTLMILAAGMGSRYGSLKQMDGVGPANETIIDYSVYDAIRAGFGKVVFIIREHFADDFKERVTNRFSDQIAVEFAFQEVNTPIPGISNLPERQKPWGTAHAMLVARDLINEPFAVINADDYYGQTSFSKMADFLSNHAAEDHYNMIGFVLANTLSANGSVSRGVCAMDTSNVLETVVERTKIQRENGTIYYYENEQRQALADSSLVSMNFWGFHPSVFKYIHEQFIEFVENNRDNPKAEFFIPLVVNNL
ncbi:MAG: sugar phosphate nucleotidyltransferase, partial [Bacteroidota bacterium]